jgi:putative SOS response-associated peptidase YedK
MCGRFVRQKDIDQILEEFSVERAECDLPPSYNIAPTQQVAVIIEEGVRKLTSVRWGLVPPRSKDLSAGARMINARAETVAEKDSFKDAFRRRRCLVVADGFYEWKKVGAAKQPVYIRLKDGRSFGFAGLYENWMSPEGENIRTCTIITTDANEIMRPIHDRMPAIIRKDKEDLWLEPVADPDILVSLLTPYPSDKMEAYRVSRIVNSAANDSPDCLTPVADDDVPNAPEHDQPSFAFED